MSIQPRSPASACIAARLGGQTNAVKHEKPLAGIRDHFPAGDPHAVEHRRSAIGQARNRFGEEFEARIIHKRVELDASKLGRHKLAGRFTR